jgi:hypothetical protein
MVIQEWLLTAVQVQLSELALTINVAVPSAPLAALEDWLRPNSHPLEATPVPESRTVTVGLRGSLLERVNVAVCVPALVGVHRMERSAVSPAAMPSGAGPETTVNPESSIE